MYAAINVCAVPSDAVCVFWSDLFHVLKDGIDDMWCPCLLLKGHFIQVIKHGTNDIGFGNLI